MKWLKSAVFWVLIATFTLSLALFFLAPLMGLKTLSVRFMIAGLCLVLGILLALILKLLQMGRALKSGEKTSPKKNPFDASLAVQPWLEALRKETEEALSILRSTGKTKAGVGQNPLDVFRIYLMLGHTASGKTSLLENSGVHFPRRYPGVNELSRQTRTFSQWWLSSQGIFLEAPARYASGEEGDEELSLFLKLIDSEGKKTALDGLILVVSLREMLAAGDRLPELAARFRDRIASVQTALRLELPVYVVFTQSDLLPGFGDFFSNLRDPDTQQILGATFGLKGNLGPIRQRFEREYKRIWDSLAARTPYRLAQVSDMGAKQRIFAFANEFGAAQDRLGTFLEHLFKESMARERPLFRGFFLTSILPNQEANAPSDPFGSLAQESFHPLDPRAKQMRPQPIAQAPSTQPQYRSLFTHLIFNGVLRNDGSLSRFPAYRLGSVSRRALLAGSAMALVALLLLAWSVVGYFTSTSRLADLSNLSLAAGRLSFRQPQEFEREFSVLDSLLHRINSVKNGEASTGLMPPGYGHSGEAVRLASAVYQAQLDRLVTRAGMRALAADLEVGSQNYAPSEHGRLHDNLKLYLLMSPEGTAHFDEVKAEELIPQLMALWGPLLVEQIRLENLPPGFEATLEEHARFFANELLASRRGPVDKADSRIVTATRTALLGTPSIEGLFSNIINSVPAERDLTLAQMGVPADAILKSTARVRGFFTKAVFDEDAMDRIASGAEEPHRKDWVLGENASMALPPEMQDQRQLYKALVDRYYQEYEAEWKRFLQSLTVQVPPNPGLAAGKFAGFATSQGPSAVFARTLQEVNLLNSPSAAQKQAEGSKYSTSKLGRLASMALENRDTEKRKLQTQFVYLEQIQNGGVLQEYLTAVKGLDDLLNRIVQSGDAAGETMMACQQLFQGKSENTLNQAWSAAVKVRGQYSDQTWLFPILENPARDVATYLSEAAGKQLEVTWQQKVMGFYRQNLQGRYPLVKAGAQEASLDDLKGFFNPENGVFATFVNGKLAAFVKEGEEGYSVRTWNGVRVPIQPNSLRSIWQAVVVGHRLYTDNPPTLRTYTLNLTLPEVRNTARVLFRLGDDKLEIKPGGGQARGTFRWPNENTYKGAEILVEAISGGSQGQRIDGSWGLIKLLDRSRALNLRPGGFTSKWRFNVAQKYDVDVLLEANLPERDNPFNTPDYFRFELPNGLLEPGATVASPL